MAAPAVRRLRGTTPCSCRRQGEDSPVRYRVALIVMVACLVACCGPRGVSQTPRGQVIDGWPAGEVLDCAAIAESGTTQLSCDALIQVAIDGLAARDLLRLDASSVTLRRYRQDQDGVFRSGGAPLIVVFELPDHTLRAIGLKLYPGDIPPHVIDFGP